MKLNPDLKADLVSYLKEKMNTKSKPKVSIVAPFKLSDQDLVSLKKKIEFLDKADIELRVDTRMLAGIIIQFGSKIIDLSLKNELQKLEQTLYETA